MSRGPGAEACPADDVLRDVIAARMSWDPVDAAAPARLTVALSRRGKAYTGRAAIVDAHGVVTWERPEIRLDDCASVVEGLGFAVAIHLDPAGPATGNRARPSTAPAVVPVPAPVVVHVDPQPSPVVPAPIPAPVVARPVVPASPVTPAPSTTSPRWRVGGSGGIAIGVSPAPVAPLVGLDVAYMLPPFSVGVEARAVPPSSAALPDGARLTTGLYGAAVTGCGRWNVLVGCGVLDVGALVATSSAAHPVTGVAVSVRTGIRGGVEVPIGGTFGLRLTGDALLPVVRGAASIDGHVVWTAPIVAGAVQAGITASF